MAEILDRYFALQNPSATKLRVWSLVVTIFGDAIEPRGGVLRLGALQKITDHIGIESNALRTAMSRLASDGWLERQRIGRASYYNPTPMASIENTMASKVIYRFFPHDWNGKWIFAVPTKDEGFGIDAKAKLHKSGFAFHSRKLAIAPHITDFGLPHNISEIAVFNANSLDGALAEENIARMIDQVNFYHDCDALYTEFANSAAQLAQDIKNPDDIGGLDALVLRILLVHQWRRIVLRDVFWPRQLRAHCWPGFPAQSLISQLYHRLLPPSENWLSQLDATPGGKLPDAGKNLASRFEI